MLALPFPSQPNGYEWLDGEPTFDPERDLALAEPDEIVTLRDLGYGADDIAGKATDIAASTPFRVLSEIGAATMLEVSRRLEPFARRAGNRIERTVRGGCYRSRWLRDLCLSLEVTEHLRRIYGTEIYPHPMPLHLGHLNYAPSQINVGIDKWHHDTLPLDYVMPVTDPALVPGGRFEYFVGTKAEAAELAAAGETPPPDRTVAPDFGGPGSAIALHGNMVVHRAAPITAAAERTTMVNGYVAADTSLDDQSRSADLIGVDDPDVLYAEWARFAAWRGRERLDRLIAELDGGVDAASAAASLQDAYEDVERAASEMVGGRRDAHHYGG